MKLQLVGYNRRDQLAVFLAAYTYPSSSLADDLAHIRAIWSFGSQLPPQESLSRRAWCERAAELILAADDRGAFFAEAALRMARGKDARGEDLSPAVVNDVHELVRFVWPELAP